METAFLENVVAAVAGELHVPAVDRPDLLGAELAVDEDEVGGEAEGPQGVEARDAHRRASAHDDLKHGNGGCIFSLRRKKRNSKSSGNICAPMVIFHL